MSDLYLDLRRRIPVVTEWTDVGSEEMERAQARTGLSDERLARLVPIAAKTWVRWKKRGAIPTHLLPKVAPILGFELQPSKPVPLSMLSSPDDLREALAVVVALLQRAVETAERCEDALGRIEQATAARGARRAQANPG